MLAAIMVIFKEVNPIRSNIEIISTLIIVYTCVFGITTLVPVYVFVLVEIALYGLDIWSVNYIYIWTVLVLVSLPFKSFRTPIFWAIIAGIYGLAFGALCTIPYFFIGGVGAAISYWTSGLTFDFIHCAGNFTLTLVLYKPLYKLISDGKNQLQK